MKHTYPYIVLFLPAFGSAQVSIFDSVNVSTNSSTYNAWLSAAGVSAPTYNENFESYAVGTNLNGVALIGGVTITDLSSAPNVTVQSSSAFFGSSIPFDNGLALRESRTFEFNFSTPTQYVGLYDIDDSGSDVTIILTDNTSVTFSNLEGTASSGASGEFLGFVSSGAAISKIRYFGQGGDGEWGIDELQYGVVPEPASMTALAVGIAAMLKRKRSK